MLRLSGFAIFQLLNLLQNVLNFAGFGDFRVFQGSLLNLAGEFLCTGLRV